MSERVHCCELDLKDGVKMELTSKLRCLLFLSASFSCVTALAISQPGTALQEIQENSVIASPTQKKQDFKKQGVHVVDQHDFSNGGELSYKPYPTGFYIGASGSVFYRDMRGDSAWRFEYDKTKKYDYPLWGPTANLEVGYQGNKHWGVAVQSGWVATQKVTAGRASGSDAVGDYRQLNTCWAALLLRMRVRMDYRYYFIAEVGPAYAAQTLKKLAQSAVTRTHDNQVLPTAVIGIQYRATERLNVGLQYQLIWGQQNWRDAWAGTETRFPALQMLGIKLSYQFNA